MNYNNLKISVKQAEEILFKLYKIKGKVFELPGEIDFNFRIKTDQGEGYILKISRPHEDLEYLDFYQKLLQYVEKNESNLVAPQVINDVYDNSISKIADDYGTIRNVRLLTWISGS